MREGEKAEPLEEFFKEFVKREGDLLLAKIKDGKDTETDRLRYSILKQMQDEVENIVKQGKEKRETLKTMEEKNR